VSVSTQLLKLFLAISSFKSNRLHMTVTGGGYSTCHAHYVIDLRVYSFQYCKILLFKIDNRYIKPSLNNYSDFYIILHILLVHAFLFNYQSSKTKQHSFIVATSGTGTTYSSTTPEFNQFL
jgi:hypothetical protein